MLNKQEQTVLLRGYFKVFFFFHFRESEIFQLMASNVLENTVSKVTTIKEENYFLFG